MPVVCGRRVLGSLHRLEVIVKEWGPPIGNQYFKSIMPDVNITVCPHCNKVCSVQWVAKGGGVGGGNRWGGGGGGGEREREVGTVKGGECIMLKVFSFYTCRCSTLMTLKFKYYQKDIALSVGGKYRHFLGDNVNIRQLSLMYKSCPVAWTLLITPLSYLSTV